MGTLAVVEVDSARSAAWITLNRPERKNALSIALRDEVSEGLQSLAANPDLKSVVITGAGDVFSAGFDLGEFRDAFSDAALSDELWASSDRFHHSLLTFPLPLIAAVNGPALAGGFDLAVCCDLHIASDAARFAHPEFTFGDVVYSPLRELVGGAIARDLCLTGREVSAEEAVAMHLVNRVVPADSLVETVEALTARIATAPRDRLVRTKAKVVERAAIPLAPTLDL